jgi:hypothetical protein
MSEIAQKLSDKVNSMGGHQAVNQAFELTKQYAGSANAVATDIPRLYVALYELLVDGVDPRPKKK